MVFARKMAKTGDSGYVMSELEKETSVIKDEAKKKRRLKKRVRSLILKTVLLVGGIYVLITFIFGIHVVHDNNMFPSIRDGDLVITYRLANTYMTDHVFSYTYENKTYFGRIVGVAGDVIDISEEGGYTVNGNVPFEDEFYETMPSGNKQIVYPYTVPANTVFILADYRLGQLDSRNFGAIPTKDLKGEVALTLRRRGF